MLEIKDYIKAKHTPAFFLLDSVEKVRDLAFQMLSKKLEENLNEWAERYRIEMLQAIEKAISSIHKGDKGDSPTAGELLALIEPLIPSPIPGRKGDKGDIGDKPIAGIDFESPKDGRTPTEAELKSIIKPMIPPPKDGSPDKPEQIARKLNTLKEEVNPEVIRGWKALEQKIKNLSFGSKKERKNLGGHGGDSTGSGVSVETPTGAVNQSNVTFTVSATPKWIVADGIIYFSGTGYSIVGLVITMEIAPSFSIRAII